MTKTSYAHHSPYLTAASIPRRRTNDANARHNERLLRGAFLGSYQALAETFRGDVFAANLPLYDHGATAQYVARYVDSANDRALESFYHILVPIANMGAALGQEQAAHPFAKDSGTATAGTAVQQLRRPRRPGTISDLYPGSYPPQVPPRRQLLRIPRPKINILPATGGRSRFTGVAQTHLDAVANLPLDLVTLIDSGQREGIAAALDEAIRRGYDPDLVGMEIANMVGLFPRWQLAVENLGDRMLADGRKAKEIAYRKARYSDWLRERRGMMIARTELMTAMNTGRMVGWHQDADKGLLDPATSVKEWLAAPGSCDLCVALNGTTVVGIDSLFDAGQFGMVRSGPCHPHCRCTVLIHPVRRADQYLDD